MNVQFGEASTATRRLRKHIAALETAVLSVIQKFEVETGMCVSHVSTLRDTDGDQFTSTVSIDADVKALPIYNWSEPEDLDATRQGKINA